MDNSPALRPCHCLWPSIPTILREAAYSSGVKIEGPAYSRVKTTIPIFKLSWHDISPHWLPNVVIVYFPYITVPYLQLLLFWRPWDASWHFAVQVWDRLSGNCSSKLGFQSNVTSMSPQPILRLRPSSSICFLCRSTFILLLSATIISLRPLYPSTPVGLFAVFFPDRSSWLPALPSVRGPSPLIADSCI